MDDYVCGKQAPQNFFFVISSNTFIFKFSPYNRPRSPRGGVDIQLYSFFNLGARRGRSASSTMGTGSFPGLKSGRVVTLTPHPLLLPWSRKGIAIPLLPLWALRPVQSLSACTRVHVSFTFRQGGQSMQRPGRFTPGEDPVSTAQVAGWSPGPVCTGAENLSPTGIRSPDCPARSELLYRLSYPGPQRIHFTSQFHKQKFMANTFLVSAMLC